MSMLFVMEPLLVGVDVAFALADQELARVQCQVGCGSAPQDGSRRQASGAFTTHLHCEMVRAHLSHCLVRRAYPETDGNSQGPSLTVKRAWKGAVEKIV